MLTIKKNNFIGFVENKEKIDAEIFIDEESELPAQQYDRYIFSHGSLAYVIKTGGLYVMGSDGIWYNSEDGTSASTDSEEINESS